MTWILFQTTLYLQQQIHAHISIILPFKNLQHLKKVQKQDQPYKMVGIWYSEAYFIIIDSVCP